MGTSTDAYETWSREEAALIVTLSIAAQLPPDWVSLSPGRGLRRLRKILGVRQWEVSQIAGVRQSTVSKVERGSIDVSLDLLAKLYGALGVQLALVPVTTRDRKGLQSLVSLMRLERAQQAREAWKELARVLADPEKSA